MAPNPEVPEEDASVPLPAVAIPIPAAFCTGNGQCDGARGVRRSAELVPDAQSLKVQIGEAAAAAQRRPDMPLVSSRGPEFR